MSDIQDLIVGLNQMGFFNVSNESIQKKKFIEYRGCCLGLFFGGLASEPWKTCATTHTIEIELPNIEHHISYYDIAYHAEIYPTLQDLQILWRSVKYIEDFYRVYHLIRNISSNGQNDSIILLYRLESRSILWYYLSFWIDSYLCVFRSSYKERCKSEYT